MESKTTDWWISGYGRNGQIRDGVELINRALTQSGKWVHQHELKKSNYLRAPNSSVNVPPVLCQLTRDPGGLLRKLRDG
jgi:hypothetical protein